MTITQTINNINSTISTNIINSLQTSNNNINDLQSINAECSPDVVKTIIKNYVDCVTKNQSSSVEALSLCNILWSSFCKMNKVNLSTNLNFTNLSKQSSITTQAIQNSINNTLTQFGGDDSSQYIDQKSDIINTLSANIYQSLSATANANDTIDLFNVSAKYITLQSSISICINQIENNQNFQSIVNDISTNITQSDINSSSLYKNIIFIVIIIIISYLLITLIMTLKRSSSIKDFLYTMLPYFIWFILALITTLLHILVPPKYVTYTDLKNNKHISQQYLALYLGIYYLSFAIIIFIIFKIINRNSNKVTTQPTTQQQE